jgi:hypothetical protein
LNKEEVQSFYKIKGIENTILVSDALDLAALLGLLPTTPPKEWFFFHSPHVVRDSARSLLDQISLMTTLGG